MNNTHWEIFIFIIYQNYTLALSYNFIQGNFQKLFDRSTGDEKGVKSRYRKGTSIRQAPVFRHLRALRKRPCKFIIWMNEL